MIARRKVLTRQRKEKRLRRAMGRIAALGEMPAQTWPWGKSPLRAIREKYKEAFVNVTWGGPA